MNKMWKKRKEREKKGRTRKKEEGQTKTRDVARGLLELLVAEREEAVQKLHRVDDKKVDVGHGLGRVDRLALRQINLLREEGCHLKSIVCVRALGNAENRSMGNGKNTLGAVSYSRLKMGR